MPEYLAPGVFIEETSFRSKSIEGVSTTTTGFVGPTRFGPTDLDSEIVTSLLEFERTYGGRQQLLFGGSSLHHNFVWHGVRAFFEQGGKRLYVARVFRNLDGTDYEGFVSTLAVDGGPYNDGHARGRLAPGGDVADTLFIRARFPGASGNVRVLFRLQATQNVLTFNPAPRFASLSSRDVVFVQRAGSPLGDPYHLAEWDPAQRQWLFTSSDGTVLAQEDLQAPSAGVPGDEIRIVTLTVQVIPLENPDTAQVWEGLALDQLHTSNGAKDSLHEKFLFDAQEPAKNRGVPLVIDEGNLGDGLEVLNALFDAASQHSPVRSPLLDIALEDPDSSPQDRTLEVTVTGGNDGERPNAADYLGEEIPNTTRKTGLKLLEDQEDISIVAAPGSTFGLGNGYGTDARTIIQGLISHCERMRYRIAVLDSGNGQIISDVRKLRAEFDSSHAALYYPWVKVLDPVTRVPIYLPPSGFVAGIYARNDVNRAVFKAPANEVVNLALGFEVLLSKSQQEVLNPEGINAFRFFEGRGYRLWGARTTSSDPEWKYVNLRRYFAYLERSIDKGTQWAVFEPNGEQLWANVRRTVEDFLFNEWSMGALLGEKPEKAYFVKCDRSTMTQNDLDNGRLVCLVGVAPLRPAEFVIFRIGQWTGDRR
jgi:phage tail sheath protein FI